MGLVYIHTQALMVYRERASEREKENIYIHILRHTHSTQLSE